MLPTKLKKMPKISGLPHIGRPKRKAIIPPGISPFVWFGYSPLKFTANIWRLARSRNTVHVELLAQ